MLQTDELDTRLVMRPLRNTERVLNNAATERLLKKEKELGDKIKFEDILPEVAGVYPRIMQKGEMDAGAWSCGMVAGLIRDVPTVKRWRIVNQAETEQNGAPTSAASSGGVRSAARAVQQRNGAKPGPVRTH